MSNEKKFKKDLKKFDGLDIVYHSIKLKIPENDDGEYIYKKDYPDRLEKTPSCIPIFRNKKLESKFIKNYNATIVPMGQVYNLIGIDIDNKDDTMQKYKTICKNNNYNSNTFTMRTMQNGLHEYYSLSDEQIEKLKSLNSLDGKIFGLNIDVKYNNQILFGPSVLGKNNEFSYSIINDVKPIILPTFLENEILKHINYKPKIISDKNVDKKVRIETQKESKKNQEQKITQYDISNIKLKDKKIKDIIELLDMLDHSRFDDRQKWFQLGCCLHNIDIQLLGAWVNYSQKSQKFKNGECEELWSKMNNCGLNIGSLHYWAQSDNPEKYKTYKTKYLSNTIHKYLLNTNDAIAKIFYKIKKNTLVCAQVNPSKIWFMFVDGVWVRLEDESKIRSMVNKELIPLYRNHSIYLNMKIGNENMQDDERKMIDNKILVIQEIILRLQKYSFVTEIINQSIIYFKHDKFIEKLDTNKDIICFGNELFDLEKCEWRESLPSDFCSLKCGVSRDQLNDDKKDLVDKLISDIFTNDEIKKYVINILSTFLSGSNVKQLFDLFQGAGSNGKSFLCCLLNACFGDYYVDLPTSLITGKELKANEANPELYKGRGRRIAVFSEPEEGSKLNNSVIKKMTGGEPVSCRQLYGNPIEYKPLFHIVILCNLKFELQDISDDSMPRRIRYTFFKTKFVYEPKNNFQRLRVDNYMNENFMETIKGSFMKMLIDNYIILKKNNLKYNIPKEIVDEKNNFVDNNDDVKVFIKEMYTITDNENDFIQCKNLYAAYQQYNKSNNKVSKIKENVFKARVSGFIPFKERLRLKMNGKLKEYTSSFTNIKENVRYDGLEDVDEL